MDLNNFTTDEIKTLKKLCNYEIEYCYEYRSNINEMRDKQNDNIDHLQLLNIKLGVFLGDYKFNK